MTTVSATLWDAAVIAVAVVFLWRTPQVIRQRHQHRRCANKHFMQGYRAGYKAALTHDRRATVEAAPSPRASLTPVVRPRPPADTESRSLRRSVSAGAYGEGELR